MYCFKDFKGFADASLDLSLSPVTVLIGRNGSGKSNAIEAIELLGQLVRCVPLYEIGELGRGSRHELRGGLIGATRNDAKGFCLEFGDESLKYSVEIRTRPPKNDLSGPSVWRESLSFGGEEVYDARRRGVGLLRLKYRSADGRTKQINQPANSTILMRLQQVAGEQISGHLLEALEALRAKFPDLFVFDPSPQLMRNYERQKQRHLARNGSNLSSVLHALHTSRDAVDRQNLQGILEDVRSLPEEPIEGFDFVATPGDVMLALRRSDGHTIDARLLSDGFLRTLAVLTALATAERGDIVVVEELDNGLHPSRAKTLLDAVWRQAERRGVRLLVTTHNPALLDSLDEEKMRGVVLCHWDEALGASSLTRLTDLPDPWVILRQGELGRHVTQETYRTQLASGYVDRRKVETKARLQRLRSFLDNEGDAA
ncbi:MAG: ATP-binding protein [Deltaproteobacteria bacterium]|nr:ATP-binding protein [Deltaproteobacteria bacterium]